MTSTPDEPNAAPRLHLARLRWLLVTLPLVVIAAVAGFAVGRWPAAAPHPSLPDLGPAPSYSLTNQLGQTVDSKSFAGKVQIVTFLFPYCTTFCPLIAAHVTNFMNDDVLPTGLKDKVQVIAFNVDPAGTGPAQMRAFLAEYGWDPHNLHWQYLTGSPDAVRRIVTNGFHISYQKVTSNAGSDSNQAGPPVVQPKVSNPLASRSGVNYDIVHNDALEIVDPAGHIRKIYTNADTVGADELARIVHALLNG